MKLNKHGLKISGLKAASGMTENYGYYSGHYVEIFYNIETGAVWGKYQYSYGQNNWTEYDDPAVIKIGNVSAHMTMQEIADAIRDAVEERAIQDAAMVLRTHFA